jgi:aminoglycoside phosphotransferase (APT) family kinase protein
VPDLRLATLPGRFEELVSRDLPVAEGERRRLREVRPGLARWCADLAACGVPDSIQHDDLHLANVYLRDDRLRVLDWGDSSISHPFASLVVTFRFLEEHNGLVPTDPWFDRLRDAYLEPWGPGLRDAFALALRVGAVAHAVACLRQRDALEPADRPGYDEDFTVVLRRALRQVDAAAG